MAILNTEFYQGEDGYSDGSIELELLEIVKNTKDFEEILRKDNRWPMFYHLSKQRQNILNWYPFDKNADLLEIGSGCGALTGLFCSKVKSVKAVELTKIRAQINYERHKDYDNLEILVGNFNNIKLKDKFDYIILNGVLEYAGSFTNTQNPYRDFLITIKQYLKEEGKILVAIENKLGIKYLNGAVEDHTARLFDGINNYPGISSVRTFSKNELVELFESAGLRKHEFYYPVPDYKFPEVIYTDDSIHMLNNNINNRVYNENRLMFYNENQFQKNLLEEKILDKFFNSFLVEAAIEQKNTTVEYENLIYTKLSNDRKKQFQIMTQIIQKNHELIVRKLPETEESENHLNKMCQYYDQVKKIGKLENTPLRKIEKGVEIDFIYGDTLEQTLNYDLKQGNRECFEKRIKNFYKMLISESEIRDDYCTESFQSVFGKIKSKELMHCCQHSNIDLIFPNIIIENDVYKVIDYEWVFDFWVPQEYVMWRSLYYYYIANEEAKSYYETIEDLLDMVKITEEQHQLFLQWDLCFGNQYVKDDIGKLYEKKVINVKEKLEGFLNLGNLNSSLYIDFGTGYNEKNKLNSSMCIKKDDQKFEVLFNLKDITEGKKIHHIRWDPLEVACKVSGLHINIPSLNFSPCTFYSENNWDYFMDNDPSYEILGDYKNIQEIKITGLIHQFEIDEFNIALSKLNDKINQMKNVINEKDKEKKLLNQHLENCLKEIDEIKNSSIWRVSSPLRKLLDKIKGCKLCVRK